MNLSHITINTKNLDDAIAFYQTILGLHIVRDLRGKGPSNIVFLSDEQAAVNIELIENKDDAYKGSGLSIGFAVDNLDQAADNLKKKGITPGAVISPNPHTRFFFILDPNGVSIQLIETK